MNHLIFSELKVDKHYSRFAGFLRTTVLVFLILTGISLTAEAQLLAPLAVGPGSGETVNCPAACPGRCWFVIDLVKSPPDTNGCFDADVNMFYGSTNPACKADIDRVIGSGSIDYTLCDGTKCNLSDKNFPDGRPYPYPPGSTPADTTKEVLSKPCHDSIVISPAGGGVGGGTYKFKNVKDISADFTMQIFCYCGRDTIRDSIPFEYNIVIVEDTVIEDTVVTDDTAVTDTVIDDEEPIGVESDPAAISEATTIYNRTGLVLERIFPNPVGDQFTVRLTLEHAEQLQFTIVNSRGEWVQSDAIALPAGKNDVPIRLKQKLEPGQYYYLLIHRESGDFSTTRLLVK